MAEDSLRILVATDNHLGVWESDPIRKDDSFETFEEIFKIAKAQKVDFVLLGGDLFHENKPSRNTVVKAMDILTKYCMNDDDIEFEILSDQRNLFTTGRVNYENPNLNIGLPVFTIHGNHDDPSTTDNTSAVDILASANLVNYFGKTTITGTKSSGEVKIKPILISKGRTKLALYGLGNIRDERMCRLFNSPQGVEWARPASNEIADVNDWVNVFVLHQNRVAHLQGAKNIVKETHLPKFLDVVVWGHEHECISQPWSSLAAGGAFSVMQPGSSVATALSEGESKKKHVFLLEIKEKRWRTIKIPLETVRPFVFDSIILSNHKDVVNPGNPDTVTEFLSDKVDQMIARAGREKGTESPELPLIRLRVDYSGFSTINTQSFAQQFMNKVANPQDLLMWQKSASRRKGRDGLLDLAVVPAAAEVRIEDLIGRNLVEELRLLPEMELAYALNEYVQKDEKSALVDMVKNALKETQHDAAKQAKEHPSGVAEMQMNQEDQLIAEAIKAAASRRKDKIAAKHVINAAKEKATAPLESETTEVEATVPTNRSSKETKLLTPVVSPRDRVADAANVVDITDLTNLADSSDEIMDEDVLEAEEAPSANGKRQKTSDEIQRMPIRARKEPSTSQTKSKKAQTPSEDMDTNEPSIASPATTRVSTRARALAGLRASQNKTRAGQSGQTKWGSLKKK